MDSPDTPAVINVSRRRYLQAIGLGVVATLASGDATAAAPPNNPAPYPTQPHIVTAHGAPYFREGGSLGWSESSYREKMRTIRGLHPDLLDFHRLLWVRGDSVPLPGGVQNQLRFSLEEELPGTAGQTPYIRTETSDFIPDRYEYLRKNRQWAFPDGTPVRDRKDLFAKRLSGEYQGYSVQEDGIGIASVFCPAIFDILTFEAAEAYESGFVGMFYDSVTTPRVQGLDASRWAQNAFRQHLQTLSDERREELGVTNPNEFDITEAIEAEGVTPGDGRHPATSPIYREYTLFHHRGLKALVQAYSDWVSETYPTRTSNRQAQLYANHYVGDELTGSIAASIYTADPLDSITVEDNRTKPPEYVRAFVYKLFRAASRGEKPVLFEGPMQDVPGENETLRGLDPTQSYPTLMRLQLAEAYAQGVPRKLELTGWGNISADKIATNWIQPDGSIPERLQSFADFLFVNRRFLTDVEPDANVAVVYSMPTNIWESAPQWDREDEEHANSFRGTCRALTEAQMPYDVRIFGHERLWNDDHQLTELTGYDVVILPGHVALGDRHEKVLERVLDGGGSVVVSGAAPNRDEYFRRRNRDVFRRDRVVVLDDDPGRRYIEDGASADGLVQEVRDAATVSISSERRIGVSRLRQRDVDRVVVHLVNYDWEEASDEVIRDSDVEVSVADLPFRADSATYFSPQTTEELEVDSSKSGASVTIPSVNEWGFVVFAESRDDLRPDTTEKTAQRALEHVRERLSVVRNRLDTPSVWRGLVRVELFVDEASLAFDSGAYTVAVERATHAEQSLKTLVESANVELTESSDREAKTTVTREHSTSSTETETETVTQTPGFTVGTAFSSTVGGLLALRRSLAQTEDGETE